MCRALGYVGPPIDLHALLVEPDHSLEHQSYRPAHQLSGVVNGDGWGVGWYDLAAPGADPPRYRTTTPMWADRAFGDMAAGIRASVVLAAVRSATPPLPVDHSASPPFRDGHRLFALNGWVEGFTTGRNVDLRAGLSRCRAAAIEGTSDAEVVFAMVLDRLDDGLDPASAIRDVHAQLAGADTAPRNLFLSDGGTVVATRWRNSLFVHDAWRGGRVVASEPLDDGAGWTEVPDASLVVVGAAAVTIEALSPPTPEVPA